MEFPTTRTNSRPGSRRCRDPAEGAARSAPADGASRDLRFARDAWFKGLALSARRWGRLLSFTLPSRVGSTRPASLRTTSPPSLPANSAGIAVALATGDQNAVDEDDADAMRRSGLTHLLSVSGLHIAAVVAFAMFLTLKLLALSERLALRIQPGAGRGSCRGRGRHRLHLADRRTGPDGAELRRRAFDPCRDHVGRDAISIRLIAAGALVVFVFRPGSPGRRELSDELRRGDRDRRASFDGLVAPLVPAARREAVARRGRELCWHMFRPASGGNGADPLALYHFHRSGLYGVGANIIAIPLDDLRHHAPGSGCAAVRRAWMGEASVVPVRCVDRRTPRLAHAVASAKGAVALLPSLPGWSYGLMIAGGIWLCLWNGRIRLFSLVPCAIGAAGAALSPAPQLLITGDGKHLAIVAAVYHGEQ